MHHICFAWHLKKREPYKFCPEFLLHLWSIALEESCSWKSFHNCDRCLLEEMNGCMRCCTCDRCLSEGANGCMYHFTCDWPSWRQMVLCSATPVADALQNWQSKVNRKKILGSGKGCGHSVSAQRIELSVFLSLRGTSSSSPRQISFSACIEQLRSASCGVSHFLASSSSSSSPGRTRVLASSWCKNKSQKRLSVYQRSRCRIVFSVSRMSFPSNTNCFCFFQPDWSSKEDVESQTHRSSPFRIDFFVGMRCRSDRSVMVTAAQSTQDGIFEIHPRDPPEINMPSWFKVF